jgi:hypothetical protein
LRLFRLLLVFPLLLTFIGSVFADNGPADFPRLLPEKIGKYRQGGGIVYRSFLPPIRDVPATSRQEATYFASDGSRAIVALDQFRQDSEAYEALTISAIWNRHIQPNSEIGSQIGTAGYVTDVSIAFFKGTSLVRILGVNAKPEALRELAQALSETLDKGENDIPVLIKHLPNPEEAQKRAIYLNSFADLNQLGIEQPVFSAIESGGNAEAVLADYGPSKLLIVEFNTPQLAAENDQRIIARIHELWNLGQPAPTAYRRVGNYSVFVFDAPDEQTAKQLIDQVKYEQVVQWLGDNPNIFKEAEKRYINTTLGVLVAVLKASGFALITCLGMGGLIGALLFNYRRTQQRDVAAYSDAGGMLRLNLDEMTPETNPARLLRERN